MDQVSGAADQDGEDLFSGADLFYIMEENGHLMGISRPSVLPFIFLDSNLYLCNFL